MSISLFPSNTIKSDSEHASLWVCITIAVSAGDLCSGWKMWSYKIQWLSASRPGVQNPAQCGEPGAQGPVHVGTPKYFLAFWTCSHLNIRGFLSSPIPATSNVILFWKITPYPPCLIAIKGILQSLFNSLRIL